MTSLLSSPSIFCDYLDVTFSPGDAPFPVINRLLLDAGFDCEPTRANGIAYRHDAAPSGVLLYLESRGTLKFSASGAVCAHLRDSGSWHDYLSELSSSPHRVTRLDAAMDIPMDGADLVDSMRRMHASGEVNLTRKAVPATTLLGIRDDGRETGTWYAGRLTRARFTARVYDKAFEALQKRGELMRPTARVEVTAAGGDSGATLRDAAEPVALFWHIASPALLKAPEGVPVWSPGTELGWTSAPKEFSPADLLKRRVESFAMLDALALVADDLGPEGRNYLLGLIAKRLKSADTTIPQEHVA